MGLFALLSGRVLGTAEPTSGKESHEQHRVVAPPRGVCAPSLGNPVGFQPVGITQRLRSIHRLGHCQLLSRSGQNVVGVVHNAFGLRDLRAGGHSGHRCD